MSLNKLPFIEELKDGFYVRTFSQNLSETELKWHWDNEDRIIICEKDTDWMFQMDNTIPLRIEKNKPIFIPEGEFHRIIKGTGDLVLKVKKLYNGSQYSHNDT